MQYADTPLQPVSNFSREHLQAWMQYMEDYGQVWLDDIGKDYFSQEYWYLFVNHPGLSLAADPSEHQ